jgi:hypothetical protein
MMIRRRMVVVVVMMVMEKRGDVEEGGCMAMGKRTGTPRHCRLQHQPTTATPQDPVLMNLDCASVVEGRAGWLAHLIGSGGGQRRGCQPVALDGLKVAPFEREVPGAAGQE